MPLQWSKGLAALTSWGDDAEPSEARSRKQMKMTASPSGTTAMTSCVLRSRENEEGRVWKLKGNPTGDVWRMEKNPNSTDVEHGEGVPGTMTEGADILASYQVQPLRHVIGPYSPMT